MATATKKPTKAMLANAKRAWDDWVATFWRGVSRKKPLKLSNKGMAAYHRRWADSMRDIADRQQSPPAEKYYRRLAKQHEERAMSYEQKGRV